jgi:seryl-tRNA synthetase
MSKTIDIEVWIPSMNIYKEVSSVSNALDYQARRGNIKYRDQKVNKNEFVHTLNGSGLATSRLIPAILEQFQQKDGSVKIPKVLWKYAGFKVIKTKNGDKRAKN